MPYAFEASVHPRFPDKSDSPVSLALKASFTSTAPLVPCYIGIESQIWTRSRVRITTTVMRERQKNKRGLCTVKQIDNHKPRRTKRGSFYDKHNTMGEIALSSGDV